MPSIALPVSLRGQLLSGTRTFSPASLFSANESGVWFDPSDTSTLFQDPAGTTPVTTPGQTVGLMLDKSKGLARGAELVANGTFDTDISGWTSLSAAGGSIAWNASGYLDLVCATGAAWANTSFTTVAGQTYKLSFDVVTSDNVQIYIGTAAGGTQILSATTIAGSSTHTRMFVATGATAHISFREPSLGVTTSLDNISVRELAGNHATQATLTARPTYSIEPVGGRRNLLTWSEDFRNTAAAGETRPWNNTAATITPDFDGNADRYVGTAATTVSFQTIPAVAGQTKTFAIDVKNNGGTAFSGLRIRDVTGGLDIVAASNLFASINSSTYTRLTVTYVVPAGCTSVAVYPVSTVSVGAGVDILLRNAQDELGSTATAYQRVTTQYDVTEAGVASVGYLWFDGVSNNMVTSSVNFTSTNKMTAFAGYRAIEKTGSCLMFELSTNAFTSVGAFSLNQGPSAATTGFGALMNTGSGIGAQTAPLTIPYTSVASLKLDSALVGVTNEISLRMDGVTVALPVNSGGDSGTGNFGNYPFYIGMRNGSQFPFKGHIYSLIARGALTDAPTITSTEIWVGDKTGIDIAKNISTTIYTRSGDTILDRANSTIERRAV